MFLTLEKLKARLPDIVAAAVRATLPIEEVLGCAAPGAAAASAMAAPPPAEDPAWRPLRPGERWGGAPGADGHAPARLNWGIPADAGGTHWLRARVQAPEAWSGQPVLLALDWGPIVQAGLESIVDKDGQGLRASEEYRRNVLQLAANQSGQSSVEAIVYLDGRALAGIDEFHRAVLLPAGAHAGAEVLLRCYVPFQQPFGGLRLQLRDETIFRLGHLMRSLLEAVETYRDSDPERHALIARLNQAYNTLDLREGWQSERLAESAQAALELLREGSGVGGQGSGSPTPDPRSLTPTLVATGHAHLDVAWLWPLWRTRQKVAHTVATALHLMERYPDYHFSMSQPQVYAYLREDDPELYARMREAVAAGRFEPVGMMWIEADCNVSGGEALVRQLLHGAQYFADEFGIGAETPYSHVVWLPDVFGYSAALPQLLRGCGINCFMTTKISWNQFNRMPHDTFRWRGIDGSEVLTHFVTVTDKPLTHWANPQFYTYNAHMSGGEIYGTWNHYREKAINQELLYIYGWGDGGGGPTEEMLEASQVFRALPSLPQVRPGRIEQFFERLYERVWDNPELPTWSGELYLEFHRGTYTSQARTKQNNRAAELRYREAEWLNAWATTLGAPNRQADLDAGWKLILLNQFHDILPGSSVPQVYADSNAQYAEIQRIGLEVGQAAMAGILTNDEGRMTNDQGSATSVPRPSSFVVWNSLPWERRECVRIEVPAGEEPPQLTDGAGSPLETQPVEEPDGRRALLAEVAAPSYGYTTLTKGAGRTTNDRQPAPLAVDRSTLENDELRIELDDNGEIASLYDKRRRRQVVAPGSAANQLVAYEDRPLQWDAWDVDIFYEEKPYPVREIVDWRVCEAGPLRAAIEITRRLGQSTIRQRICLSRGSRRIDFATDVDWQERQTLLRALFPLDINATRATCEIQFGAAERPTHRNTSWDWARFEVCAHRWVDLSEGDYGVALLNDGKYGHSLHHNVLGLSLLKSATHPDPEADRGQHRFTYSLLPHEGDWRAGQVVRRAYELNAPLFAVQDKEARRQGDKEIGHAGVSLSPDLLVSRSFLSTTASNVVVETIKVAQDGDGLIVRLYEAHNQRGPASLAFDRPVASAVETDLLERETGVVEVAGNQVRFEVRPFEIKTLRVRLA